MMDSHMALCISEHSEPEALPCVECGSDSEAFASLDTEEWLCEACCQASDNAREHKGE